MDPKITRAPVTRGEASAAARSRPWFYWALGAVVAVFGAVRFGCLFNDLWLDEIWSLRLLEEVHSPGEILTRLWHDNNHPLNSLFLYLLMPAKADWTYRLLSWFTGTATVWLAGLIARRQFQLLHPNDARGTAESAGLIGATLVGGSYLLIHYSSEARGYAPAVGFSFLAIYALLHAPGRRANAWAAVYGLACVLGLLSHLATFQVMLAGAVWSVVNAFRTWDRWRDRLIHLACWHIVPWTFLALYYVGFIRKVEIGGGNPIALSKVLGSLAAFSLGLPSGMGREVALPIFLGISLLSLSLIWRRDRALGCFYTTVIFIAPALGLCSSRFIVLYPRYFIVSAAGALLLAGYALASLGNPRRAVRAAGGVMLAGFLIGNGAHTLRLLRNGRGQYQRALRYIAEHTPTAAIALSSDLDFRNLGMIQYYAKAAGVGRDLKYYSVNRLPVEGPQWVLMHRLDGEARPADDFYGKDGWHLRLDSVFPHSALSGWTWYVYRNLDQAVLGPLPR